MLRELSLGCELLANKEKLPFSENAISFYYYNTMPYCRRQTRGPCYCNNIRFSNQIGKYFGNMRGNRHGYKLT